MAKVSLSKAAKDTGVSLPTLSRWRKKGLISAEKNDNGGYLIDTSEYDRISSLKKSSSNVKDGNTHNALNFATPYGTSVLQIKIEVLEERLKEREAQLKDMQAERDDWKDQAKRLLLQAPGKPLEAPNGFWAGLLRKNS